MTEQPSAAAEQAQADADLTHAVQEEQLASDLAVDEQADAAVAADEAQLQNDGTAEQTTPELAKTPEPPAEEQGAAPTAGETADGPNVSPAVGGNDTSPYGNVTNALGDGDTSGGAGLPVTDPSTNAPTDVVTPGTTGDAEATPNPYDPTGGSNAGASIAPSQGDVPQADAVADDAAQA